MGDVRKATGSDRSGLVETVVAAFDRDPAFRAFFGDENFGELAPIFVGELFDRRVSAGSVWVGAGVDSVAMWDGPGLGHTDEFQSTLPRDVQERIAEYDRHVAVALADEPHWYLGILGSHPRRRGQGWARRTAAPGLAAAEKEGVAAYLETTNPGNVAIYERWGWRVVDRLDDVLGLTVWVMRA